MEQETQNIMREFEKDACSFVIRLWREKSDSIKDKGDLRGRITHVQSGRRVFFRDMAVINDFINECFSSELSK